MTTLPWQRTQWAQCQRYQRQHRIPQALLIHGNNGVGKRQLAEQFAKALLCEQPTTDSYGCNQCASCLLFNAQTHPDLMRIQPEEGKTTITVQQIRELINKLSLKPQFERYRVVIFAPADKMNNAAANAFLKCLEEPTERTVIMLLSDKPSKLPATIISRCQKLAIATPEKTTALHWLAEQGLNKESAILLNLAQGAPLLALQYAKDNVLSLRNDCFQQWLDLAKHKKHAIEITESWLKLPENALLFWLTSWIVDLIKCTYQSSPDNLYNLDLHSQLQSLTKQLDSQGLYRLYDLLLQSRAQLETQINKQSMLEEILLLWSELNRS